MQYYRDGLRALRDDNPQLAHEYGAIAHDLGRAIEHAECGVYDRPDDDLPAPPRSGREGRGGEARKDLTKAYERLREGDDGRDAGPTAKYYRDAAGDLYRAARRDFEAGRTERAAELPAPPRPWPCRRAPRPCRGRPRGGPPSAKSRRPGRPGDKADREGQILPPPPEPSAGTIDMHRAPSL